MVTRDTSQGAVDDPDIQIVLDWLLEMATDRAELEGRIARARHHYVSNSYPRGLWWPDTSLLIPADDGIAGYLAQLDAMLTYKKGYDLYLGSCVVPFFKVIGHRLDRVQKIRGIEERVHRLLRASTEHPLGVMFELVTAARYAREGFNVEFIAESQQKTADMKIVDATVPSETMIECKRLRASDYEKRESASINRQNADAATVVNDFKASLHVDVRYTVELANLPDGYLAKQIRTLAAAVLETRQQTEWRDEFCQGTLRIANIDAVRQDLETTYLRYDSKLARLLTGAYQAEGTYQIYLSAKPAREDPRYIDKLSYVSIITSHVLANESIEARARHIRAHLGNIDQQMAASNYGIAHIGMEAERDSITADLRRERNLQHVRTFIAHSALAEVHIHYFLPRTPELAAWTIDETADSMFMHKQPLLKDARVLCSDQIDIDGATAAWHLPPPPSFNLRD